MKKFILNHIYTILVVLLLVSFTTYWVNQQSDPANQYKQVTIQHGDTVWSIATQYESSTSKQAEFVSWVEQNNSIDANNISPGQKLYIPVDIQLNGDLHLADAK